MDWLEEYRGMGTPDEEPSPLAAKGHFDFSTLDSWQVYDPVNEDKLALFPEGRQDAGDDRGGPKRDLAAEKKDERKAEKRARYYEEWPRKNGDGQPPPFDSSASESDDDDDGGGRESPSLLGRG